MNPYIGPANGPRARRLPVAEVPPVWNHPASRVGNPSPPPVDPCVTFSSIALETVDCNFAFTETDDRIDLE